MRFCYIILSVIFCSCRTPHEDYEHNLPLSSLVESIAQTMDDAYVIKQTAFRFNDEEREQLKSISFFDPLSLVHPRYFDRVNNIEKQQVKRSYLNYTGGVSRTEFVTLSQDEFWKPLKLLSMYYRRFGSFPVGSNCSIPLLESSLNQKRKK